MAAPRRASASRASSAGRGSPIGSRTSSATPTLDAVVLATPVPSHAELAVRVLEAGKHCFVEKPLAQSVADAERVVDAQRRSGKVLMVGHLLQYHPGVNKLKEIADSGELGDIRYIYGNRLNLGQLRADENALWSLGAHDVSVVLHLAGEEPYELVGPRRVLHARRGSRTSSSASCASSPAWRLTCTCRGSIPHKERRFTVVGSKRMATFDDMDPERKITIYDKGFDESAAVDEDYVARSGDIWSPRVAGAEPLRLECEHFVDCVRTGREPISDGARNGLAVVRVLEGLQASLDESRRGARRLRPS